MSWGFRGWVLATITDGSENFQDIYLLSVPASLLPCIHTAVILYQLSFSLCSFPLCESGYLCSFPWPFLPVLCCKASHLKWATQLLCSFIYSLRRVPNTCQVLLARPVKRSSAMQETWVQSLGWEDPLEKGMATHSQKSCLGNPMDRGAWLAMVFGVTKSWTQLKQRNHHHTQLCVKPCSSLCGIMGTVVSLYFQPLSFPSPRCVYVCVYVHVLSHATLFVTLWTIAHQAPLSMEFLRRE